MSDTEGKIVEAYAEWDDRGGKFRVYLVRETTEAAEDGDGVVTFPDLDGAKPMYGRLIDGDPTEIRLYRAAFLKCAKDIAHLDVIPGEPLGWPKEAPAKRVAAAVTKEIAAIAAGKPGPTNEAIQIAIMLVPKKKSGRRR